MVLGKEAALFSERRGHRTRSPEENPQQAVLTEQGYLRCSLWEEKTGPAPKALAATSRPGQARRPPLGKSPVSSRDPKDSCFPGEEGLCPNCVVRAARPRAKPVKPRRASQNRSLRAPLPPPAPGLSPSLHLPQPAGRAPHPSRVPAALPLPVEAAS